MRKVQWKFREIQRMRKIRHTIAGFEDGGKIKDEGGYQPRMWAACRSWSQPLINSQQENGDLSLTTTKNWIL